MEIAKIKKTPAKEEKSKMKVKEPPLTPTPTKVIKMTQMNEKIKFRIIKTPIKIKKNNSVLHLNKTRFRATQF